MIQYEFLLLILILLSGGSYPITGAVLCWYLLWLDYGYLPIFMSLAIVAAFLGRGARNLFLNKKQSR